MTRVKYDGSSFVKLLLSFMVISVISAGLAAGVRLVRQSQEIRRKAASACNTCYNFNGSSDGLVDVQDILFVANRWNENSGSSNYNVIYDVYCSSSSQPDGTINILDIQTVANRWNTASCSPSAATSTPTRQPTNTPSFSTPTPTSSPGDPSFNPFGSVTIGTGDIAFAVNGVGSNVDTIAFWEASDPTQSLMFVTSKSANVVEVWKYPFQSSSDQLSAITGNSCMNTSGTNGVTVNQDSDLLYVTTRYGNRVCVFNLPSLSLKQTIATGASSSWDEPNLALLKTTSGQTRLYVSYSNGDVYIFDANSGSSLGNFKATDIETMWGDNYYQKVYIPTESGSAGIRIYSPTGSLESVFGSSSDYQNDEEGIWVYSCPSNGIGDNGEGVVVVSDQTSPTQFEFYNRKTKQHLGNIVISGVGGTDGIAFTQQSSPAYPKGIFAAIDSDTSTVGVRWDVILSRTGLTCGD
jgi:hypothetical protein